MARKRVLVVDDSRSARVLLSRILEKYEVEVDLAESAEQAIEYLKSNRPDAIFMDHLMPGMDGLQAVREIKGNPQTAMIPIMMYTSQEGELYVGQARALGAMGVLPKQLRPVDVSKVLYELHLLPNRRDSTEPALSPVDLDAGTSLDKSKPQKSAEAAPTDIRRFIADALNSAAARIVRDIRDAMPMQAGEPLVPLRPLPPARPIWPAAAILAACFIACAFAASWFVARNDLASARAEIAGLTSANSELQRSRTDLSAAVKELTAALAVVNGNAAAAAAGAAAAGSSPSAIAPRAEPVPYGEIPFDRSRIDVLRELLATLESQGFHGVVKVTNVAGNYCLSGNGTDGYTLAAATLPVSRCDVIGNPFAESLSSQQRESLAFANLVDGVRQRTAGTITVAIESQATGAGAGTPYPTRSDTLTAGEWNRAAAANNRVEFSAEGSP